MHQYQALQVGESHLNVADDIEKRGRMKKVWNTLKFWKSRRSTSLGAACTLGTLTLFTNLIATVYLHWHPVSNTGYTSDLRPLHPSLYQGSCSKAENINKYVHLVVNALSTLLLAASNMFMQLLLAPTRAEIDKAHQRQRWLSIGIASLRNLRYIRWRNRILWLLLALSSLPLHLVYNSAIYLAKPVNSISMAIVTPDFMTGAPAHQDLMRQAYRWRQKQKMTGLARDSKVVGKGPKELVYQPIDEQGLFGVETPICTTDNCSALQQLAMQGNYYRRMLDPYNCLMEYSKYDGDRANVIFISSYDQFWNMSTSVPHFGSNGTNLLVTKNGTKLPGYQSNSLLFARPLVPMMLVDAWLEYNWLCGNTNSFSCRETGLWTKNREVVKDWNILGYKIDSCYVEDNPLEAKCSVHFSVQIMLIVCFVNLIKLACMLSSLGVLSDDSLMSKPLSTTGDALSSFLSSKDEATAKLGLRSKKSLRQDKTPWSQQQILPWKPDYSRRSKLVSTWRLFLTFGLAFAVIIGASFALYSNFRLIAARAGSARYVLDIPFGSTTQATFAQLGRFIDSNSWESMMKGFMAIALFANLWQLLLSIVYISFNALLTCFCVENEWQSYASKRKALRVSSPLGTQRSTYFLSLPWRYGLSLMASSTFLHWTLSQSIFLTMLTVYKSQEFDSELIFMTTSPWPILTAVAIGLLITLIMLYVSFRKTKGILPHGGTCSAIISAASHRPSRDVNAALGLLQWGELIDPESAALGPSRNMSEDVRRQVPISFVETSYDHISQNEDGHCCFTTEKVIEPTAGKMYIGGAAHD